MVGSRCLQLFKFCWRQCRRVAFSKGKPRGSSTEFLKLVMRLQISGLHGVASVSAMKLREPRVAVRLSVRVKTDFGWGDAHVHNVSSRGMMATCATPPTRGTYVEVRRGAYVLVGRVVWSSSDQFGLLAQDRIVLSQLRASATPLGDEDRRREPRKSQPSLRSKSAAEIQAGSGRFARAFDFGVVAAAAIGGALILADTASEAFAEPLEKVRTAMEKQG